MPGMPDMPDPDGSGLDDFLSKVDKVSELIKDIKSGDDKEAAMAAADSFLENDGDGKVTSDRSVINRAAAEPPQQPLPPDTTPEQAAFLRSFEKDAHERHQRRLQREADALIPKNKGNEAFKRGEYEAALALYQEAERIDPASPAIYSNLAQVYIKLGDFEKAEDKADWAVRADERWLKGYLRRGIAQRALGKYAEAVASFKEGRSFSLGKDRQMFERQLEDTQLAQELSQREDKLKGVDGGQAKDDALRVIELGSSKFQHSALDPKAFIVGARMMAAVITTELHQDFFRLRGGVRLLRDAPALKKVPALHGGATTAVAAANGGGESITMVCAAIQLVHAGVRGNEASRRELVRDGKADVDVLASALVAGDPTLTAHTLTLTAELAESPRASEVLLKAKESRLVAAMVQAIARAAVLKEADAAAVARPGFEALGKLTQLAVGSKQLCAEFDGTLDPYFAGQLGKGGEASTRAVSEMIALSSDPALRAKLASVPLTKLLLCRVSRKADALPNTLGMLCNLCLEPRPRELLQSKSTLDLLAPLLQSGSSAVVARAALLLSRLCTTAPFVGLLVSTGTFEQIIKARRIKDEFDEHIFDAVVRIITKCMRLKVEARTVVNECGGIMMLLPALKAQSAAVIGNAALAIADLATDKDCCAAVADSTIVADLLNLARRDKCTMTENCGIALSRLAAGHPAHRARLRELDGFEVLHSRVRHG